MESTTLLGEVRKSLGKADAKGLRKAGQVPCIIYGGEKEVHFSSDARNFRKIVDTTDVFIVKVEVDGKTYDTVMKDVQFHPLSDNIIHVDFQLLTGRPVILDLPIRLNGNPIGVRNGGVLATPFRTLTVKGDPKGMPDSIELNVENMKIGELINVGDLDYPGLTIMNLDTNVVVAVRNKRGALEDEEGEGAEGEEATEGGEEGAEGGDSENKEASAEA
jgi:large subunit ribosomal protein L25